MSNKTEKVKTATKVVQKKDQQKNNHKKEKQNEKKKNPANGVQKSVPSGNSNPKSVQNHNKNKNNNNKNNQNKNKNKPNKHVAKASPKKISGSILESVFVTLLFCLGILVFLYAVDYDKFVRIKTGAGVLLNKTASALPPEVTATGKKAFELVRPVAEVTVNTLGLVVNQTSTFLNTNPLVKDHWANVRDISSICSARLLDYVRTLYLQITGYCNNVKSKLF